ncbi:MAG: hypothetical protein JXB34_00570 [Bacteroidales bacterium]|nr:hypothetical protein [Bacteroidales bacterium]
MKKALAIILLLFYVSLSAVNIINFHFCHGELKYIEFTENTDDCCDHHSQGHEPCCTDITLTVDFEVNQLNAPKQVFVDETDIVEINKFFTAQEKSLYDNLWIRFVENPPSEIYQKLYKAHHSFLFYG